MACREAEKRIIVHSEKKLGQLQEPEFKCKSTEFRNVSHDTFIPPMKCVCVCACVREHLRANVPHRLFGVRACTHAHLLAQHFVFLCFSRFPRLLLLPFFTFAVAPIGDRYLLSPYSFEAL